MRARDKQVGGWGMEAPYNVRSGLVARAALGLGWVGGVLSLYRLVWALSSMEVCVHCVHSRGFFGRFL